MSMIRFDSVAKNFDGDQVLDGLSFEINSGEVVCLVGPSGTGKSVTLKHIVGLIAPDSGKVWVNGVEVNECDAAQLRALRSRIGYLFQSGALLAWLTIAENVALPLRECTKMTEPEIEDAVNKALKAVELTEAAEKYPAEISGGMQKRAGLARAIVLKTDIVLYDEPTSGLDPVTSVNINKLIRRLSDERGITSIVVTHDIPGALKIADRMLFVSGGKVVEFSPPAEFVNSKNPLVIEFLAATKGE